MTTTPLSTGHRQDTQEAARSHSTAVVAVATTTTFVVVTESGGGGDRHDAVDVVGGSEGHHGWGAGRWR